MRMMSDEVSEPHSIPAPALGAPTRVDSEGTPRSYLRFAALGDSVTFGLGDPVDGGFRGWARLLAAAIGYHHDVSLCNTARTGATVADVRIEQLATAAQHRPHVASLVVGLNDTMRSTWDPDMLRADLLHCAATLTRLGAVLLTVRFHDHSRVFRLPSFLARPMRRRIEVLNAIYDEVHHLYGGLRVDLATHPGVYDREFWSVDRLHPSPLGHRALAEEFAALSEQLGLRFDPPVHDLDGRRPTRVDNLRWMLLEGVPWVARRVADLAPVLTRRRRVARTVFSLP